MACTLQRAICIIESSKRFAITHLGTLSVEMMRETPYKAPFRGENVLLTEKYLV